MPLVEFDYNNSYQTSIDMTTYEALYVEGVGPQFVGKILVRGSS